eukprot:m51a1_g6235 hypothetical protein (151) ;mRNA; f:320980-323731
MKQSFTQRIAAPTKQYSYIQVYGFSPVPMDGAQELAFDGGYSTVQLPWRFSFGGVPYNTMYVSQRRETSMAFVMARRVMLESGRNVMAILVFELHVVLMLAPITRRATGATVESLLFHELRPPGTDDHVTPATVPVETEASDLMPYLLPE